MSAGKWELTELPLSIDLETKKVLKALPSAHAVLAELKGLASSIPNQNILINTLGLPIDGKGEIQGELMDNYVTFMAGIFRSIRFGGASAHGKANLLRFYYFKEMEAFTKNEDGTYSINFDKMQEAMNSLSDLILTIQGDGDYERVSKLMEEKAVIGEELQKDLDRLQEQNIPIDVVWEQGLDATGL